MRTSLTIHVEYEAPPVPIRSWDWQGWVDGEEERFTVVGPDAPSVLRGLADELEACDE